MKDDTISRQAVLKLLHALPPEEAMTKALLIQGVKQMDAAQPEQQWILCDQRMPEEREWIGTRQFGTTISDEVYVTFERPDGVRFAKHLCFQNGKLSNYDQRTIDVLYKGSIPIAWMPLPEPYRGEEP